MKVYVLEEYTDFGEDGVTHYIPGVYSTPELAVQEVQQQHQVYDYTGYGLHDFRLYEAELDKPDNKQYNYCSFKFTDKTERAVCLDA